MEKIYFKFLLFLLLNIAFNYNSFSQFTGQRTFSTGSTYSKSKIIEIPGQGFIKATEIPLYNPQSSYPFFQTIISKINYNYDTIWVKKIDSFSVSTLNFDSLGIIIICGNYTSSSFSNPTFYNSIFSILKINSNGSILNSKSFDLFVQDFTSTYYFIQTDLIIDISNNLVVKYMSYKLNTGGDYRSYLIKLDQDLNVIYAKKIKGFLGLGTPSPSFIYLLLYGKLHFFDNNGFYIAGSKQSYNFYNNPQADIASRQICKFDNFGIMVSNKVINEASNTIDNLIKTHSGIKICGNKNLYSYNQFGQNLPSKAFCIDFNSSVGNSYLRHNYTIAYKKKNSNYFSFAPINNKIFATQSLSGYAFSYYEYNSATNVNDSTSNNARVRILKLKDNLSTDWCKRLHIFGTSIPLDMINQPNSYTTEFSNSYYPNLDLLHLSNRLNKINLAFNKNFVTAQNIDDTIKRNTGVLFTALDSTGSNANCNITDDDITDSIDNVSIIDLPLISLTDTILTIVNKTFNFLPYTFYSITDTCLPLKKTKSRFIYFDSNYTGIDSVTCVNSALTFYESAYNEPRTWKWILPTEVNAAIIDSSNFPNLSNVRFTNSGVFPIKLVTINVAGSDTLTKFITVINFIPQPNLGNDTSLCAGDSLRIIYTNPPNSLHNFSGGNINTTSDTIYIKESGEYYIDAYTSCGNKYDTIVVNFADKPTANFGFINTCNNLTVNFTNSTLTNFNPSLSYVYAYKPALALPAAYTNFSTSPNNTYTFNSYDSFDVRLIVTSSLSCVQKDTIVKRIVLKAKPTAACSYTNVCSSLAVNVTNSSSIAAGSISSYQYFVGNTLIAATPSFTYSFAAYGSYTIAQVVQSNFVCVSDTFFLPVVVKAKPITTLSFANDSVCANTNFTIISNAGVAAATVTTYFWQINNGAVQSNATNARTENLVAGSYNFKHWVRSSQGCESDTVYQKFTVVGKPVASIAATNICGSKLVNFTVTNNVVNDNLTAFYINYGNGVAVTNSTSPTNYTYPNFGSYTIQYLVTSSIGCAGDTAFGSIVVKDKPVTGSIGYSNNACENVNFTLTSNSSVADAVISNYYWQINNGAVQSNASNTRIENLPAGSYNYKHWVRSSKGCEGDTVYKTITVDAYPQANFTVQNTCVNKPVVFANNSTGNIALHTWELTPVDIRTGVTAAYTPVYAYTGAGNYFIKLTTATLNGCANSSTKPISIESNPTAAFAVTEACLGKIILLQNNSSNVSGAITDYNWLSGSQVSSNAVPDFIYNNTGHYDIRLNINTANGCTATALQRVSIRAVQLFATADTGIAINQPLQLNISGAQNYSWLPADNLDNALAPNPLFSSAQEGIYLLTATGTTAQGCKGTEAVKITVYKTNSYLLLPNAFTPNGDGLNDYFKPVCAGLKELTSFTIYNRYGQPVFNQKGCGTSRGWDGKFKAVLQNTGAFVFVWNGVDFKGKPVGGKGSVMLVR